MVPFSIPSHVDLPIWPDDDGNHDDWVLMQFTGLRDRHGKEIYEGDIISSICSAKDVHKEQVEWDANGAGFSPFIDCNCTGSCGVRLDEWEVLGNIYESPELLEATG